ncbi:MAG: hypothetical protein JSV97_02760 [candidate division WOR-3 bacterium]|nr:MAG: hypothetical protein JSV97_02760 [candidate division WOR-3 bacterium]
MSIFLPLYLRITKRRFNKIFQPLTPTKKPSHVISLPRTTKHFLQILPFLTGLRKSGSILVLVPKTLENIYRFIKSNVFETLFYEEPPHLFSKEYKSLKDKLGKRHFHCLIELNIPPNLSLPYLISADKRICFYGNNHFPYYNILIKNTIRPLIELLRVEEENPQHLFSFPPSGLKKVSKRIDRQQPLLFINRKNDIQWNGTKIVVGLDIPPSDAETYQMLYLADAYYGEHDAFYEFAKIFNKRIIE